MASSTGPSVGLKRAAEANPNLLRDRLANERTFLAWLRTGIAVTSLGFVVAKFDIFLQEVTRLGAGAAGATQVEGATAGRSAIPIGLILVLAGPAMVMLAAARYVHTDRALVANRPESRRLVRNIIVSITGAAAVVGIGLAAHLISVWPG